MLDAAVDEGVRRQAKIAWTEVLRRREGVQRQTGSWLPDETVEAFREYLVGIKGPLTTPIGGGIRSLNVALRQMLDLYVCLRPVRWFTGRAVAGEAPREGRHGDLPREHRGHLRRHRVEAGTPEAKKVIAFLQNEMRREEDPLPRDSGIGIKPVSREGTERLDPRRDRVRDRAQAQERHPRAQGQHHEVHRGRVPRLGLRARAATSSPTSPSAGTTAAASRGDKVLVKDAIADITLQQVLTRPDEFDVIATLNLNGDYLSDALAAQVGGIGIAPGGNINYVTGHAHLRGDARHRAEVRRPGQGEPGLGASSRA